ncbi:tetratricopeptide repeat protein [Pyrinomonas methylaliphatogenes]|uniref:Anaphase-promoting complex, cyclosome, subunit 3 n=1 Tax=Pyrinomonas methylaliphatogenes TaxID=454194 RepID=A0A0B6X356_9BACT|nr:tetratricopeptide repeat protein [Pyrinomonas methylaliphatogenes]CDM66949.1 Anaphase-promoting complex, cyclosome, subunit 3 [Pyrinomonas methylaliphatogenes]
MTESRVEILERMLASDPENPAVLFGLAKEYEKLGRAEAVIETLKRYLDLADDEGNAYGMLARAYEKLGKRTEARAALERGIAAAERHGHPSMAEEYRMILESDYAE